MGDEKFPLTNLGLSKPRRRAIERRGFEGQLGEQLSSIDERWQALRFVYRLTDR